MSNVAIFIGLGAFVAIYLGVSIAAVVTMHGNDKRAARLIAEGRMTPEEYAELQAMCRAGRPGLPPSLAARTFGESEES